MLAIADEDEHARHFWMRDAGSQGLRPMEKYLRSLAGDPPHPGLPRRAGREGRRAGDREHAHGVSGQRGHPPRARRGRARPGPGPGVSADRCQCEAFAAVTERAALASARWLGRGDVRGAEDVGGDSDARRPRRAADHRQDRRRRRRGGRRARNRRDGRAAAGPRSTSRSIRSKAARSWRAATTERCP